jgi:hypothetical protein
VLPEGPKLCTVETRGPILVSADVHGHYDDFARLRAIFLESDARGEQPTWVSVGDWVHGPSEDERRRVTTSDGEALYDYPDRTPELLRELFALMDAHAGRVVSLCGNHEHAHIGGRRTRKFHDDEAAHLESRLTPAEVADLRRRVASWPMAVRLPACGVIVTHGALAVRAPADLDRVRYQGPLDAAAADVRDSGMFHYGFSDGADAITLRALSDPAAPYSLVVHVHDRDENGWSHSGESALLLCTSFGARRSHKTYLWLTPTRRYHLADLREGEELRRLY